MFCPNVVYLSLQALENEGLIEHVTEMYCVSDGFTPYPCDAWAVTMKGLDYLETEKRKRFHFWMPIITSNLISLAALIISIAK